MNRLTHPRNSGIKTGYWSPEKKDVLIERLAAYEDTELTPSEIYALMAVTILRAKAGKAIDVFTRWIPVEEQLPEEDDIVLVTVNGSYNHIVFSSAIEFGCYCSDGEWFIVGYPEWDEPDVIAWMPLPEPYRENEVN